MSKLGEKRNTIIAVVLYLVLWEILARAINSRVLLVGPISVLLKLFELIQDQTFWLSILFSLGRIFSGLLLAIALSVVTSVLSIKSKAFRTMLEPMLMVMKATPVASITILILIWVSSRNLSVVISFMMVFPVMHQALFDGIRSIDKKMIEMARIYNVRGKKRLRYLYLPLLIPHFESGITIALALCFKSGIAAEVIAVPDGSIGEKLYEAKLYLATADLFAWTVAIILLAKAFEKILLLATRKLKEGIEV